MQRLTTALSAFSARATRGRRVVLVGYSLLITLAILGLSSLIAKASRDNGGRCDTLALADMLSIMLVGAALFVVAPAMVSAQVAEERRQGTLDLLRTAPLSPTALTAGFLLGAPGSLYLLCVGPLGLHVLVGLMGRYPIAYLPLTLLLFAFGSMATMLFAVVASIALGREGSGVSPMLVGGLLAMAALTSTSMAGSHESLPWAFLHPAGGLALIYNTFDGPFRAVFFRSWQLDYLERAPLAMLLTVEPAFVVAFYFCASALLMSAARRVLSSDPPSKLEKPTALALFALLAMGVVLPLRFAVVFPAEFELGTAFGVGVALFAPYFACVLAVTPSSVAQARGRLFSASAAPHLTAVALVAMGLVLLLACYGHNAVTALSTNAPRFFGLMALALTAPIYSLWASTRIQSGAGRLAFWAFVAVHASLQVPAIIIITERDYTDHLLPLAQVGVAFGIALPLFIAWRQRRADHALC